MNILLTLIVVVLLGGATYAGVEKVKGPEKSQVAEADYKGTLLVGVDDKDQKLILAGQNKVSFPLYAPGKVPKGFKLRPTSVSAGMQGQTAMFQTIFSKGSDNLIIFEYSIDGYLLLSRETLSTLTADPGWQTVGDKKIYIPNSSTKTSGKFQYLQGATAVTDTTVIRLEYFGEGRRI